MLILPVHRPSGLVVFSPVPFWSLGLYEALRSQLLNAWEESDHCLADVVSDPLHWHTIEAVLALIPRQCSLSLADFFADDYLWLEKFLFADLEALHTVEPLPPPSPTESDGIPTPSSGDRLADLLADLSREHGLTDALRALQSLDLDTLNKVLFRLNESARDPAEREAEELQADYDAMKEANPYAFLPKF